MADKPKFVSTDLDTFQRGGVLWAVNQFVLWPIGLALTMTRREDGEWDPTLHVSEWQWPDGHLETIESDSAAGGELDFDRWLAFCDIIEERLGRMPITEREAAARRLALLDIPASMQTGRVIAPTTTRPRWNWVAPAVIASAAEGSPDGA